jgi:MoxR-like ATPase
MPKELRAVVIDKFTSIISDMSRVVQENAKVFMQEKLRSPRASEDLISTAKLLAELAGNESIVAEAQELEKQLATMSYQEICTKLIGIQKMALAEFVGKDKKLDEESVRQTIESRFGIKIIKKQ